MTTPPAANTPMTLRMSRVRRAGKTFTRISVIALPITVAASRAHSLVYLVAFGAGTVLSMSLFGAAAGYAFGAAARTSWRLLRVAASGAALASVAVGAWWLVAGGW